MDTKNYAKLVFRIGAIFNFGAVLVLLFARPILGFEQPLTADTLFYFIFAIGVIATFGVFYWLAANDPEGWRGIIPLAMVCKAFAFIAAAVPFALGQISFGAPAIAAGDLIFVYLFWDVLRRIKEI